MVMLRREHVCVCYRSIVHLNLSRSLSGFVYKWHKYLEGDRFGKLVTLNKPTTPEQPTMLHYMYVDVQNQLI